MSVKAKVRGLELQARVAYAQQLVFGPDHPDAIPYLKASIERFPKSADLRMMMSIACGISRPEKVAPEAKLAAQLAPLDLPLQVRAGFTLVRNGEVKAAGDCAARVREQAGDDYSPLTDLVRLEALVKAYEGDYDKAEEEFRWAVTSEPENMKNAYSLAEFLWARGRDKEAVAVIDDAMLSVSDGPQALLDLRAQIVEGTG
jgi:tetratricopeptide (TPR) repeat protein